MSLRVTRSVLKAAATAHMRPTPYHSQQGISIVRRVIHSATQPQAGKQPKRTITLMPQMHFPLEAPVLDMDAVRNRVNQFINGFGIKNGEHSKPVILPIEAPVEALVERVDQPKKMTLKDDFDAYLTILKESSYMQEEREEIACTPFHHLESERKAQWIEALSERVCDSEESEELQLVIIQNLINWLWREMSYCDVLDSMHTKALDLLRDNLKNSIKQSHYPGDLTAGIYQNLIRPIRDAEIRRQANEIARLAKGEAVVVPMKKMDQRCLLEGYLNLTFTPQELDYLEHLIKGTLPLGMQSPQSNQIFIQNE